MSEPRWALEPERIDELPLALGLLDRMYVAQAIDAHLGAGHGHRQGLSARIIMMPDHRLAPVERWL